MGLDAVEIVMGWEAAFGITIADGEAFELRNTRMAVDLIAGKLGAGGGAAGSCLSLRAFNRLRGAFVDNGVSRGAVQPLTQLRHMLTNCTLPDARAIIRERLGISKLPLPGSWTGSFLSPGTIGGLVDWIVSNQPTALFSPGEKWSRAQVRQVVRAIVIVQIGAPPDYADEADFVDELGLN